MMHYRKISLVLQSAYASMEARLATGIEASRKRCWRALPQACLGLAGSLLLSAIYSPAHAVSVEQTVAAFEILSNAPESDWRELPVENLLMMDLPSGRIIIEMRPDFAPKHVAQIKQLTRSGFYDGIIFHRVIEGFMAQGGDPTGTGRGRSDLPNIEQEFFRPTSEVGEIDFWARDRRSTQVGFIDGLPVSTRPASLPIFMTGFENTVWAHHCKGIMSMARGGGDPNSANSQFFLMFDDARSSLDRSYSIWGRVVDGIEHSRRINRGEPAERPTPIVQMRMYDQLVEADEPEEVRVLRTDTETFKAYLRAVGAVSEDGYIKDICGISIPGKINGKVEF